MSTQYDQVVKQSGKMSKKERAKQTAVYTSIYMGLGLLVLISVVPFILVMMNATRTGQAITEQPLNIFPGGALVDNWHILMSRANVVRGFFNSLFVSTTATFLSGYFGALTAYAFYVYKFKGNKPIFVFLIIFLMVPPQLAFIGFYQFMSTLGFVDTFIPLIVPMIANIGTIFFLRQYAEVVLPKVMLESARIDGAKELYVFHKIGIPMMMPGIATMSIFTFIGTWNNYLMARIMLNTPSRFTLPLQIANLRAGNIWVNNQGAIYLGLAVTIFPIVIFFIVFSRYLVESIAAGAVKG